MVEVENPIGLLFVYFPRAGHAFVGTGIMEPDMRRKGYITKAGKLLCDHLFDNYPIVRIQAETDVENIGGQKSLEKIGFEKEGVFRNFFFHHGRWHDFAVYSLIRK